MFVLFFILCFSNIALSAQSDNSNIGKKATYIKNFCLYTTWQLLESGKDTSSQFRIYIIGDSPIFEVLKQNYKSEKIKNKSVYLKKINKIDEIVSCHILFVAESQKDLIKEIVTFAKDKPILTISESNGNAEKGIIFNFVVKDNQLNFEFNKTAIKESGLYISSELLKRGIIVNP
jgi:hypothetical protein